MPETKNNDVSNAQINQSISLLTGTVQALHSGLTARLEDMRADIRRLDEASSNRMNRIEDNLTDQIAKQGEALTGQIANQGEVLNKRIDGLDKAVGDKIAGLGTRVTALENEDKRIIEKVAKFGALGGGVGGTLAAAAIELIKHIPH
jgi:DNA anti-recombination protein RmuC